MRTTVFLAVMLLACIWAASRLDTAPLHARIDPEPVRWVHTVDGWENANTWRHNQSIWSPSLHPIVVAAMQVLASILALAAISKR